MNQTKNLSYISSNLKNHSIAFLEVDAGGKALIPVGSENIRSIPLLFVAAAKSVLVQHRGVPGCRPSRLL